MSERWYLARGKERHGPYLQAQVTRMLSEGKLLPGDHLLREGTTQWLTLEQARLRLQPPAHQGLVWKNATSEREAALAAVPVETNPPPAPTQSPASFWGQFWWGFQTTVTATLNQAARLQRYLSLRWEQQRLQRQAEVAQLAFGEKLHAAGLGDEGSRAQLASIDAEIQKTQGEKKANQPLQLRRRELLLQLAEPLLTQVMPLRGAETEQHRALETWLAFQKQARILNEAGKVLYPNAADERRRIWTGVGMLAGIMLLLLLLLVGLSWPRSREGSIAGDLGPTTRTALRREKKLPDFTTVDYSIPKVDYLQGPEGQALEKRRVREGNGDTVLSEGYRNAAGNFVSHGQSLVHAGDSDRVKSETAYASGLPHGSMQAWFPSGSKAVEGSYLQGQKHGQWRFYFPGGRLRAEEFYFQGELHGPRRTWYENGNPHVDECWVRGLRQGAYRTWAEAGPLLLELEFVDDLPHFGPHDQTREQFRLLVPLLANQVENGFAGRPSLGLKDGLSYYLRVFGQPDSGWMEVTNWTSVNQQTWRYRCRDGTLVLRVELVHPTQRLVFIKTITDG